MKAVCWVTELVFSSHSQFYIKVVLWTSFIPNLKQHEHKENQPQHLQMQTSSLVLNDLICETTREQIYPEQSCLKPVFPFFFPPSEVPYLVKSSGISGRPTGTPVLAESGSVLNPSKTQHRGGGSRAQHQCCSDF